MIQRRTDRRGCAFDWGAIHLAVLFTASAASADSDPDYSLQWGLHNTGQIIAGQKGWVGADIDIENAWAIHEGNGTVIVAVVGPGVDAHPEFANRLLPGRAFIGDLFDTSDTRGAGTHVAGIIAAGSDNGIGIAGINSYAKLLPVRVTEGPESSEAIAAAGIVWAVDQGASVIVVTRTYHLGTQALADAVAYAASHDVLVVAPVGDEENVGILFPAAFDGCLAVSGTTNRDEFALISNWGTGVELSAPGQGIWSTARGATPFQFRSGSTMAAGFVAGVASLMRSYAPQLSAIQIKQLLIDTALDLGDPGTDDRFGAGRLDAAAALTATAAPALRFEPLDDRPAVFPPMEGARYCVRIVEVAENLIPGSAKLFYRVDGGPTNELALAALGGAMFEVALPAIPCGSLLEFHLRAQGDQGTFVMDPLDAPNARYTAEGIVPRIVFHDDFDADLGWSVEVPPKGTVSGVWVRDVPVPTSVQPGFDGSPGPDGLCYFTGQHFGGGDWLTDLDGGPVDLISPPIPLPASEVRVSFMAWLRSENGEPDQMTVEASLDDGANWAVVRNIAPGIGWREFEFRTRDFAQLTGNVLRVRFSASDEPNDSWTEAAVDEFLVVALGCEALQGDANGDGQVDFVDFIGLAECLTGPNDSNPIDGCESRDFNRDDSIDLRDFQILQAWFGRS